MAKLSDFKPEDIKVISAPSGEEAPKTLRLSDFSPNEIKLVSEPQKTSQAESGLRGFVGGSTAGFADELYGVVGAIVNPTDSDKGFADRYRESRDYARGKDAKAAADNPKTTAVAQLAAGLSTAVVPVGAAAKGAGVAAAKGAGVASAAGKFSGKEIAKAAGLGAAQGAATGLGTSTADVTKGELPEAVVDTAIGGAGGAVGGGLLNAVGQAVGPKMMKYVAERRAFKAATGNQGKFYDEAVGKKAVNERGRQLLDEKIVGFGSSAKTIAERAETKQGEVGKQIGALLKEIDDEAGPHQLVDGKRLAGKIREYAASIEGQGNQSVVARLQADAEAFEGMGRMSLTAAQKHKNSYVYKQGDPSSMAIGPKITNKLKSLVSEEMDDAVEDFGAAQAIGKIDVVGRVAKTGTDGTKVNPRELDAIYKEARAAGSEQSAKYKDLKSTYGMAAGTKKSAEKLATQHEKNRTVSLKDAILGGAGLTAFGPQGIALGVANNMARKHGSAAAAVTLDKVADLIESGSVGLGKNSPELLKAVQQSPKALALTIYRLSRDPQADENVIAAHQALLKDKDYRLAIDQNAKMGAISRRASGSR